MMLAFALQAPDLPYLGASPILRGLADDKHLSSGGGARGIATAP